MRNLNLETSPQPPSASSGQALSEGEGINLPKKHSRF
jgi:hypothetical protein